MVALYEYRGELVLCNLKDRDGNHLWTHVMEKGEKLGFSKSGDRWVKSGIPDQELRWIKGWSDAGFDKRRYKYGNHFFRVKREYENDIEIITHNLAIAPFCRDLYGMKFIGREMEATKVVPKSELISITEFRDQRLGIYDENGIVCEVVDENESSFLITSEEVAPHLKFGCVFKLDRTVPLGFAVVNGRYEKWVPKQEVYVYHENPEPIIY